MEGLLLSGSRLGIYLLSGCLLIAGCAGTAAAPGAPAAAGRSDGDRAAAAPRNEALAAAIASALAGSDDWSSLHLFTECRRDAGLESLEIFGNGVAIRDGKRQFEVSAAEIRALLAALQKADFAAMPETFGGRKNPRELQRPPRPAPDQEGLFALRVICRVELSIAGHTKRVAQLDEGEQSESLKELSEELFRVCAEPVREGIGAADLGDGLAKIGRGELAPETLRLMLHRKPEPNEPVSAEGFLLRLDGRQATSRPVDSSGRFAAATVLELTPVELRTLARELGGRELAELPVNLYAADYTDLSIDVLDHKKSVQARRFAGMSATTHGELQRRFEDLYALLLDLHRRVMAEGSPVR